jgi:heptose-I-phosphate ethanolaminephosphotransferase
MINKKWNNIFLLYLALIVLAFLFECTFKEISLSIFYNFIENILFAILLISPLYFLLMTKFHRGYFIMSYLFFSFSVYFETIYYYLFNTYLSPSAIFVLLDSNINEAKEFASFYLDTSIVIFTIVFLIITFFLLFRYKKSSSLNLKKTRKNSLKILSIVLVILVFLKISTLIVYNLPYLILKSNVEYFLEAKKLESYKDNKEGNFHNVKRLKNEENELYVIIIGESTSRSHFGLYNYYRQTTPRLNKLKDDLLIYNDVISPHVYSIGSLTKILTLGNYEFPNKISEGSMIQLLNSASFSTYWLSNQRPIGPYESLITKISLSSTKHKFITTTISGNNKIYDGKLIEEFDEVIKEENSKKIVFLHLIGTHHHYENRYPKAFNKFVNTPITKFNSLENHDKINHYDNAVLYTDFIVNEVIKKVNQTNLKSFVLYFSDHGEEVFDNINMSGHNEDVYSKSMFDVPFILWRSNKFAKEKEIYFVDNRKYMIDDLFHSIADILDITAKETDSTRSIFNKHFKERKRIIKDTIDYDLFFKN